MSCWFGKQSGQQTLTARAFCFLFFADRTFWLHGTKRAWLGGVWHNGRRSSGAVRCGGRGPRGGLPTAHQRPPTRLTPAAALPTSRSKHAPLLQHHHHPPPPVAAAFSDAALLSASIDRWSFLAHRGIDCSAAYARPDIHRIRVRVVCMQCGPAQSFSFDTCVIPPCQVLSNPAVHH